MIVRYADYRRTRKASGPVEPRIPPRAAVPSFFTVMNLFCGFLSIVEAAQGNWRPACYYILLAGLFDLLDGFMARVTRGSSEFGVQLDSLCDMVSFGLASSFLIYQYGLHLFELMDGRQTITLLLIVASLPAICGAVRLARFNLGADGEKHGYFQGLPIPAQAITVVALVLASLSFPDWKIWEDPKVLVPIIIGLSVLMVTNIKFDALPSFNRHAMRGRLHILAFAFTALLLTLLFQELGLVISVVIYITYSLARASISFAVAVWNAPPESQGWDRPAE